MRRRTWLALVLTGCLAVGLTPTWSEAQAVVTAQILDFWRVLAVGGTFSGTTLSYSTLSILTNGYANFGTTLGTNGYGIRDNAGTIQIKNQNGSWTTPAGGADPSAKYILQTANTGLANAQSLGALASGLLFNTTGTGVLSVYAGTTCTNQFVTVLSASGVATCAAVDLSTVQATGTLAAGRFPALTGDITTAGSSLATTLATVNANVGSFGGATTIPQFTVNGKGLVTAAANVTPQLTFTGTYFSSLNGASITGLTASNLSGTIVAANFPALTGDVTNAAGSLATTVGKIGGVSATLGGAFSTVGAFTLAMTVTGNTAVTLPTTGTLVNSAVSTLSSLTSIGTIATGVWNGTPVVPTYGGTGLATITAHGAMIGEGTSTVAVVAPCDTGVLSWSSLLIDPTCNTAPVTISPGATTSTTLGGTGIAAAASTQTALVKKVTGMTDAVSTPIVTVTVPNVAQAAAVHVHLVGSLGAGGAIGQLECSATLDGSVILARTPGVATVPTAAAATSTANSCVAGATTITFAYSVSAVAGAVGAQQTFTINATVTKGGGASANHQVLAWVDILNSQSGGVTIQ